MYLSPHPHSKARAQQKRPSALASPFARPVTPDQRTVATRERRTLYESANYLAEAYYPLPLQVEGVLRNGNCTGKVDKSGWCWVITGTTLLLWHSSAHHGVAQRFEVNGETHPDLVCVISTSDRPALLVLTTQGRALYWEGMSGAPQEWAALPPTSPPRIVSSSNDLVAAGCMDGRVWVLRTGYPQQGWHRLEAQAGGWGWLKSWRPAPAPSPITSLRLTPARDAYVLSENTLQKWALPSNAAEKQVYDVDLKSAVAKRLLDDEGLEVRVWLLDFQLISAGEGIVLAASVPLKYPDTVLPLITYTLFTINLGTAAITNAQSLDFHSDYHEEGLDGLFDNTGLVAPEGTSSVFVKFPNTVLMAKIGERQSERLMLRDSAASTPDNIFAFGSVGNQALFGSLSHVALVAVSRLGGELETEVVHVPQDIKSEHAAQDYFLNAFAAYTTSPQSRSAQAIVSRLLEAKVDVAKVALEQSLAILDAPSHDSTWVEDATPKSTAAGSMLLLNHLEEKKRKHMKYAEFLRDMGLSKSLPDKTRMQIAEHGQFIAAAICLRSYQNTQSTREPSNKKAQQYVKKGQEVLVQSIRHSLQTRKTELPAYVSAQDLFYSEVSKITDFIPSLFAVEATYLGSKNIEEKATVVRTVNEALEQLLLSSLEYCRNNMRVYDEYVYEEAYSRGLMPWNCEPSLLTIVDDQLKITVNLLKTLRETNNNDLEDREFWRLIYSLCDAVLTGYRFAALSKRPQDTSLYEERKQDCINLCYEGKQIDLAVQLAEKYMHFTALIVLTLQEEQQRKRDGGSADGLPERLHNYIQRFKSYNFHEHLLQFYLSKGMRREIMLLGQTYKREVAEFLEKGHHTELQWLQHIVLGDYRASAETLHTLADSEALRVDKKQTLLSLSKLAFLASRTSPQDHTDNIELINQKLYATEAQTALALNAAKPLNVRELVRLWITKTPVTSNNFVTAFDLVQNTSELQSQQETLELLRIIGSSALMADNWDVVAGNWEQGNINDKQAEDCIDKSVFYQVVTHKSLSGMMTEPLFNEILDQFFIDSKLPRGRTSFARLFSTLWHLVSEANGSVMQQ